MANSPAARSTNSTAGQLSRGVSLVLALPLVLLLGFAFVAPIGKLLLGSVFAPDLTAAHYLRIAQEPVFLKILLRTFLVFFHRSE